MGSLAPHIVAGVVLVLVLDHFSLLAETFAIPSASPINSDVIMSMKRVDHSGKGNRLVSPRRENSRTRIGTVEIVGLRDTAIVHRDREGRILFRNDPLTNTTIVTKNLTCPRSPCAIPTVSQSGQFLLRLLQEPSDRGCQSAAIRVSVRSLTPPCEALRAAA